MTRPDPPTVLHVLAPGAVGGLESVVRLLAVEQAARGAGVHVHLVCEPGPPPPLAELLAGGNVHVHVTEVPPRRYDVERAATLDLCRRAGARVVHCHGYRADVVDAPAARRAGLATVSTVHGFTGGGWRNAVYEWLQLRSLRRMDRVVAVSRPLVSLLAGRGVARDRIALLPNAWGSAHEALVPDEARRRLGVGDATGPVVGWVGRMSHEKGIDVYARAAGLGTVPGATWVAVGDGPERAGVEGEGRGVVFTGLVPEAGTLVRAFDVLVLSSRTEGTPIVALEAMAAGVPVVATRVGGVPDLLEGGAGVLVEPEDPAGLAEAVAWVLGEAERRASLVEAARRRLAEDYATGPWVDAHLALYAEIAAPPAGDAPN